MARMAQLKLPYFSHVVRASAGELALMVMAGMIEGTRPMAPEGNSGWTTFMNRTVKPTQNTRCWHKSGTVGEHCSGRCPYHHGT